MRGRKFRSIPRSTLYIPVLLTCAILLYHAIPSSPQKKEFEINYDSLRGELYYHNESIILFILLTNWTKLFRPSARSRPPCRMPREVNIINRRRRYFAVRRRSDTYIKRNMPPPICCRYPRSSRKPRLCFRRRANWMLGF
jgi:hypothetical protein